MPSEPSSCLEDKLAQLRSILSDLGGALVAFSGGVDSTFLLAVAAEVLRDKVVAVTARSPTYPQTEYERACELAGSLAVEHLSIYTDELADREFCANSPDRCYHCKRELFGKLRELADRRGLAYVLDASNLDDCSDYRPGRKAAEELGVRSPLIEAGLTKQDVRDLSKSMGLPTWDKPAMACLASRFPYGEEITAQKLTRVGQAEAFLRDLGFRHLRVRSHGDLARIEVDEGSIQRLADPEVRGKIVEAFKNLGFVYVTADLEGYRTGSMNEVLSPEQRGDG